MDVVVDGARHTIYYCFYVFFEEMVREEGRVGEGVRGADEDESVQV